MILENINLFVKLISMTEVRIKRIGNIIATMMEQLIWILAIISSFLDEQTKVYEIYS